MPVEIKIVRPTRPAQMGPSTANPNYATDLALRFGDKPALYESNAVGYVPSNDARRPYKINGRTAEIYISGALSMDPWYWDETSYLDIQRDVKFAATDPGVDNILLVVNSPGGSCDGAYETHDVVQAVNRIKPIHALAAPCAYSAAYMLIAPCTSIWVPDVEGGVGSVGVYCVHFDYSKALAEHGIQPTIISAGEGKTDGNPWVPLSEDAKARLKADVDRLYAEFVSRVATGRGMSKGEIIKLGAYCYDGSVKSLPAGLADHTGTLDNVRAALAQTTPLGAFHASANAGEKEEVIMQDKTTLPAGSAGAQGNPAASAAPTAPAPAPAPNPTAPAATTGEDRALALTNLCESFGASDMLAGFIRNGTSLADAMKAVATRRASGQSPELDGSHSGLAGHAAADPNAAETYKPGTMAGVMRRVLKAHGETAVSEGGKN